MFYLGSVLCLYVLFQTVLSIKFPPSNDTESFRSLLGKAKNVVAITGAGISPGIPAYTEAWGHWRNFYATDLDNDYTFENLPFLVWQFTHYRRECVLKAGPNAAHKALAEYEKHMQEEGKGRNLTVITTNIDGLHVQAGSQNVIEVCGSLFKTKCLKCGKVQENRNQPISPSLAEKGQFKAEGSTVELLTNRASHLAFGMSRIHILDQAFQVEFVRFLISQCWIGFSKGLYSTRDPSAHDYTQVEEEAVPHCECGGRLRPHITFQGEDVFKHAVYQAEDVLRAADLCMVIGSASELQPVNEFAPTLAGRGVPVAEFNLRNTDFTIYFQFQFKGDCVETLPQILRPLL